VLHENATEPITALGFQETSDTEDQSYLALFVVTTNHVLLYQANGRNVGKVVDEVGCALGCATMDWHLGDMFVARDEAIYVCGSEGRRDCYAHEGHKSSIQTHQRYLVIVSPPFIPKASSASATVRNFVAHNPGAGDSDIAKVTVFDAENRIVAYSGTFENGVRDVFTAWGDLYILPNDGAVSEFPLYILQTLNKFFEADSVSGEANPRKTRNVLYQVVVLVSLEYGKNSGPRCP